MSGHSRHLPEIWEERWPLVEAYLERAIPRS